MIKFKKKSKIIHIVIVSIGVFRNYKFIFIYIVKEIEMILKTMKEFHFKVHFFHQELVPRVNFYLFWQILTNKNEGNDKNLAFRLWLSNIHKS